VSGTGRFDFSAAGAPMGVFGYMAGTATSVANRLMWVDASGKTDPLTPIGTYLNSPALAPDGNSIAGTVGSIGAFNVTVLDLRRQVFTSITNKPGAYRSTVWNPDGKHLVFSSVTNGVGTLWWARADGGAEPRVLAEAKNTTFSPNSFSPDGRRLAYSRITAGTNLDIWTLPLDLRDPENPTPGTPEVFFAGPANDTFPAFSPDGRWMAYVSYESGSSDVYVRPYPRPGGRWKISQGEGTRPVWARNGRQIFFASTDGRIMRANYETHGDTFVPGRPLDWTPTRVSVNMGQADYFALDPAGKRVLSYFAPEDRGKMNASLHVNLLLNFFDELKRRLP